MSSITKKKKTQANKVYENYKANLIDLKFVYGQHSQSEKAMAPHSSTLAWKIPRTEEPGRWQAMG